MKPINEAAVTFLSRSANEGFARTAAACFAAQLDPTLDRVAGLSPVFRSLKILLICWANTRVAKWGRLYWKQPASNQNVNTEIWWSCWIKVFQAKK